VKEPRINRAGSEFHIECDRMMALMSRKAIYLFDVYLLTMFVWSLLHRVVRVPFE
jgi:hypothetical protein